MVSQCLDICLAKNNNKTRERESVREGDRDREEKKCDIRETFIDLRTQTKRNTSAQASILLMALFFSKLN